MVEQKVKKVLLTVLDGWGYRLEKNFNAVELGNNPNWQRISNNNPNAFLTTYGKDVGLPEGQMGNSEVGHINIGAGRVVYQELPRINMAIEEKEFDNNANFKKLLTTLKQNKKALNIMGLLSDGGVHSSLKHFLYATEACAKEGITVNMHIFTDGRDTPPKSAINYFLEVDSLLKKYNNIKVATICGRYYAMDRDKRWERVELAYNALVDAKGEAANVVKSALENAYNAGITDEFIKPIIINGYKGMEDGEGVFMINFRSDRAREILESLILENFDGFKRNKVIKFSGVLGMVPYSDILSKNMTTMFLPNDLKNTLGEWLASKELNQLRVAETEKYPHVTFFLNGGREEKFQNEDRILIPSPKVATYDLKPEMSAYEITENLVKAIDAQKYEFIIVNYANGDMVGHTGSLEASIKATEAVDKCLLDLEKAVIKNDYIWVIIADHGNCETMWDEQNNVPHTQHTTNPVKIVVINSGSKDLELLSGKLADVAPTVFALMNIQQPKEMTGKSLLRK